MKRLFDITVAGILLLIAFPVLVLLALLVRLNLGSPVFFRQTRPGLHGRPFQMVKFRSMREALGPDGQPLPDAQRITRLGRFLRSSSLDELPELWNVLKGDMSLVGPRPLLMEYLPYYTEEEMTRHNVRPGITGLAQVSGRNNLGWDVRLGLDVDYVKNNTFLLDIKILFLTVLQVVTSKNVIVIPSNKAKKLSDERVHRKQF